MTNILIKVIARESLQKYVAVNSWGERASNIGVRSYGKVLGITQDTFGIGLEATVVFNGEIINNLWSWAPGSIVFLNGTSLSTTPPLSGFSQKLGIVKNPNTILVELGEPIML